MMTDENYVFNQTIKERKAMAIESRHKINGCKSKKCTLPHENLTRKELEKMNGEVITLDLNHFYTWDEFLTFSEESKTDYIEHIIKKYSASISAISGIVFGNTLLLGRYITDHMLPVKASIVRGYAAKKGKDALKRDIMEQRNEFVSVEEINPKREPEFVKYSEGPVIDMDLTLDRFDDDIWMLLKNVFKNQDVDISIQIRKKR